MTCRYIDPLRMKSEEDKEAARTKGRIPDEAMKFVYNGC
jgi:hypothetical protein